MSIIPQKKLIGALLLAVGLFMFWVFPYPAYQKISTYRNALAERDKILTERKGVLNQVIALKKEYDQRAAAIRQFSAVVPSKTETAELISALEQIAGRAGVQIIDVTVSDTKQQTQADYQTMTVSINGKSTYSGLVSFLESMERNIRLIDVSKVDAGLDATQGSLLNFSIQAEGYFLK